MAAKFRGNSDDWIDDEKMSNRRTGSKVKKDIKAKSVELPWEQSNAVVVEVFPKQCRTRLLDSGKTLLCSYRWAQLLGKGGEEIRTRAPVTVGDRVKVVQNTPDSGVVEGLCVRRNSLARVAPGRDNQSLHHVVAANVDSLVIVASIREPEFSPGLVDRYLIAAAAAGIAARICATKKDLAIPPEVAQSLQVYRDIGVPTFEVSAKSGAGLLGETVFCGHSGVGKTSLLNALLESVPDTKNLKIGEVSASTGKGRHTTTSAVMIAAPEKDQFWIDTPGVREFSLAGISARKLSQYFPEFRKLDCTRKRSCMHIDEAECEAKTLPRYASYRRIFESMIENEV
jgi:ribosome biogenesis GTPase